MYSYSHQYEENVIANNSNNQRNFSIVIPMTPIWRKDPVSRLTSTKIETNKIHLYLFSHNIIIMQNLYPKCNMLWKNYSGHVYMYNKLSLQLINHEICVTLYLMHPQFAYMNSQRWSQSINIYKKKLMIISYSIGILALIVKRAIIFPCVQIMIL